MDEEQAWGTRTSELEKKGLRSWSCSMERKRADDGCEGASSQGYWRTLKAKHTLGEEASCKGLLSGL